MTFNYQLSNGRDHISGVLEAIGRGDARRWLRTQCKHRNKRRKRAEPAWRVITMSEAAHD